MQRQLADLSTKYGDRHPKIINIKAQIADMHAAIAREVTKIAQNLKNEVAVAKSRETALRSSLQELQARALVQDKASLQLKQLQREADANRTLYENFLGQFKQTEDQQGIQEADSRIISFATPPDSPSFPKRSIVFGAAVVIGLVVGGIIVFLIEASQNAFRTTADVEQNLGVPVLATMALTKELQRRGSKTLESYLQKHPTSALAEAGRTLRTGLNLTNVDAPPKVVAVTSSVPAEGKSTTAALLAISASLQGARVIIVDCDLRRPSLHKVFGVSNEKNLVDALTGSDDLAASVQTSEVFGIDILAAREAAAAANALLSSQHFKNLIKRLRETYDFVVLDGAPLLPVSDSLLVAGEADTTVFVVKWNHTPREIALSGMKMLTDVNITPGGVALAQLNRRLASKYDYAQYGYYYRRYSDYYGKK